MKTEGKHTNLAEGFIAFLTAPCVDVRDLGALEHRFLPGESRRCLGASGKLADCPEARAVQIVSALLCLRETLAPPTCYSSIVPASSVVSIVPVPAWVLFRRLRYAWVSTWGINKLANETIGIGWRRDTEVVRVIKRVASQPPQRIYGDAGYGDLWKTPMGEFWTPTGVSATFMAMLSIEVLSDTYRFSAHAWDVPPIVIDCGANIGMFSRLALNGGAERVVCCEPSPRTTECLQKTFAKEIRTGHVTIVNKAVWDKAETLHFWAQNEENPGSHQVIAEERSGDVSVEATTIDAIVREMNLPTVNFIKMDIEGAEIHALRGAAETIRRHRPLIGMGTEHTGDIAANNEAVIYAVREIDPTYRFLCTEVHPERSPSHGLILVPYSLLFY